MAWPKVRSRPSDSARPARPAWPVCVANLLLLGLYPLSWQAPLARAGLLPWFGGSEISVFSGIADLWAADAALAVLVGLFAVVIPYGKTLLLALAHLGWLGRRAVALVEAVGRLSMADVFLVALYIIITKGVGVGYVTAAWGWWLFTACVLLSLVIAWATGNAMRKAAPTESARAPAPSARHDAA